MNKKIAIPLKNGVLDDHFGHCTHLAIFEVKNKEISGKKRITAPPHQPGLLPKMLSEQGVTDVIAGGMGQKAINIFNQFNVNVFVGAPQETPHQLVQGLLNDSLCLKANNCDH